jgi:tripartite-type tricarboxylate transporter receptor subunit TctC
VAADAAAPTEEGRRLLKMVYGPGKMTFPYAIAPGIPNDRVAALRNAFDQTLADPAFVADFNKTARPLVARSGEELAEIVSELLSQKPETVSALQEALKQREGP